MVKAANQATQIPDPDPASTSDAEHVHCHFEHGEHTLP
jgi:hypothetical protein